MHAVGVNQGISTNQAKQPPLHIVLHMTKALPMLWFPVLFVSTHEGDTADAMVLLISTYL